jgi:hypothetical protein
VSHARPGDRIDDASGERLAGSVLHLHLQRGRARGERARQGNENAMAASLDITV